MQRRLTSALLCMGLFAFSCEIPATRDLPPVSASASASPVAPASAADTPEAKLAVVIDRFASQQRMGLTAPEIEAVARAILDASERYGVELSLVLAVIHVESRYDAFAVSPVGALGLMQILPSTGRELAEKIGVDWNGPQTLFDPVANVQLGVSYLKELRDRFGSTSMALAAYNWGPGHINRRLRAGTPMPTVYPSLVFEARSSQRQRRS